MHSSLERVWISYISGMLVLHSEIRYMALSSWATSLTMSLWREITGGLFSCIRHQNTGDISVEIVIAYRPWIMTSYHLRSSLCLQCKCIHHTLLYMVMNDVLMSILNSPQQQTRASDPSLVRGAACLTAAQRGFLQRHKCYSASKQTGLRFWLKKCIVRQRYAAIWAL